MGSTLDTVLIVDDDRTLLDALTLLFEMNGYRVVAAKDGGEALRVIGESKPALVISDVNMPGMDGFALCRSLRERGDTTPLILLTTRDTDIDEALGLDLGADDYISKPASNRVLLARVKALLRRRDAHEPSVAGDGVILDHERLTVRYKQQPVVVTVSELKLLHALMRRPGIVRSRSQLIDELRGDEVVVGERLIDTYVRRLRRKLEAIDPAFDLLETVVGAGYKWRA